MRSLLSRVTGTVIALCCWASNNNAQAKRVSGDFRLSGLYPEQTLTSFAVGAHGARLQVNVTATDAYVNDRFLKLRLYRDTEWNRHLKKLTCDDKIRHAQHTMHVSIEMVDGVWQTPEPLYSLILNSPTRNEAPLARPHYWYVVMDDCMLEQVMMDDRVPKLHYELDIRNNKDASSKPRRGQEKQQTTHFSADEMGLVTLHTFTMLLGGLLAFLLLMMTVLASSHTIHAAVLWVASAAGLDAASSLCELVHLKVYERNGIGVYAVDAMAAHLEAMCDSLLILLLLSMGAGWTLPSDVLRRPGQGQANGPANVGQRLSQDLASPMQSLMQLSQGSRGSVLGLTVLGVHAGLAQWGRMTNDDFESYHDLEHLPGRLLMGLRMVLGLVFYVVTYQTRIRCSIRQLQNFYLKWTILGSAWFQSLPILTWTCNHFVPYYLRHPAVYVGSALAQSSCLVLLSWLVTTHTTVYHQYSSMNSANSNLSSLSSSNAADEPRMFKIGPTKVRLD